MVTDSIIHAHKRPHIIRSSTHRKYQSTIQHSSNFNFLRGHHLPPIDYARPRRQQSPISTLHLANLRRPLPHLEVHVSANMRCDVIIHTAALPHLEVVITILITTVSFTPIVCSTSMFVVCEVQLILNILL